MQMHNGIDLLLLDSILDTKYVLLSGFGTCRVGSIDRTVHCMKSFVATPEGGMVTRYTECGSMVENKLRYLRRNWRRIRVSSY